MAGNAMVARDVVAEVCTMIASDEFGAKVKQALPAGLTLDKFTRTTLTAIQQNPEVVTAERQSLFNSVIRCAQDGLVPDGREAALVVFNVKGEKKVQYLPMIFGLRKKAAEHGFSLAAYVVYSGDRFEWELGMEPSVTHVPPPLGDDRGDMIGAYAVATDKRTGEKYLEVMSRDEIEQVRAVSRAATSEYGPWVKWYGEQARKTVAKRLWKQLPLGAVDESTERVLDAIDDEYELPNANGAKMTVAEANVAATIGAARAPDHGGPDDNATIIGEAVDADEPEPALDDGDQPEEQLGFQAPSSAGVDDDPLVQAAREAGMFEIPNGQHRGLTLAELNDKGGKAESWFKWAVANIENPPAYKDAILAYCRVHHPEVVPS